MSLSLFSSYDYYKNKTFIRLMRKYNKIDNKQFHELTMASCDDGEEVLEQMYENLMLEFLRGARFWLKTMRNGDWLEGEGLE